MFVTAVVAKHTPGFLLAYFITVHCIYEVKSKIAVQFNHGVAAGNSVRPINLDLVVVLAESGERKK